MLQLLLVHAHQLVETGLFQVNAQSVAAAGAAACHKEGDKDGNDEHGNHPGHCYACKTVYVCVCVCAVIQSKS